jgi:hypothetical protein
MSCICEECKHFEARMTFSHPAINFRDGPPLTGAHHGDADPRILAAGAVSSFVS